MKGKGRGGPWVCIGDCNNIMNQNDTANRQPKEQKKIDKFNDFINDLPLLIWD